MNASRLYTALKVALREFPRERPFKRGPDNMTIGIMNILINAVLIQFLLEILSK